MTRLLANVSHELRTLNVILGYTETALNPAQSPSLPAPFQRYARY
ncbi:MAG: hypothetical protein U0401_14070 [Anaerolineae bacterium]